MKLIRCQWVTEDPDYIKYHDEEWGVPLRDRQKLFEMLCLEGQQAGLSWITVLKRRADYQRLFYYFVPEQLAKMSAEELQQRLQDPRIIRNRLKLSSIISNAQALLDMEANGENFSDFLWSFVNNQPKINHYQNYRQAPTTDAAAKALSNALKKRGFRFIGPTICYAFMQACGLVIDHQVNCFRHPQSQQQSELNSN